MANPTSKFYLDPADEMIIKECKAGGATLVTWDRVVRLAAGGLTPYEALDKAKAEGSGTGMAVDLGIAVDQAEVTRLRKLTPLELTSMGEAADQTWNYFLQHISLKREQASLVRQLRVEEGYSWRAVARWCSWVWPAPWGSNQFAGMVICKKAAEMLGEDFMKAPWN